MSGAPLPELPAPRKARTVPNRGRPSALRIPIQIDPSDLRPKLRSRWDRFRSELRSSLSGAAISLGAHLALLFILALIVVRHVRSYEPPGLQGGWVTPTVAPTRNREVAPVRVEAVKLDAANRPMTPKETKPVDTGNEPAEKHAPVKAVGMDEIFAERSERVRSKALEKVGANNRIEAAISNGLSWLARQQLKAGNWKLHEGYPDAGMSSLRTDSGATALALLPFLGTGNTHMSGTHRAVVQRGLDWLRGVQKPNGDFHDHEELGRQTAFYTQSQAIIALCEAIAITGDETYRPAAELGVQFLLAAQQPTLGGWKYQPQNDQTVGDLSVTGWALMALHTARAAGIEVPDDAYLRASGFLDTVSSHRGARYRYEPTHAPSDFTLAMTAEGLVCRQFLGWPKDDPSLIDGLEWLTSEQNRPQWQPGRRNVYAWYYCGHALHNVGGDPWKQWYQTVSAEIVRNQATAGSTKSGQDVRGSWNPKNPTGDPFEYGDKAGRLYVTAMSLLILEMPFRHRPVYRSTETE